MKLNQALGALTVFETINFVNKRVPESGDRILVLTRALAACMSLHCKETSEARAIMLDCITDEIAQRFSELNNCLPNIKKDLGL